MIITLKGADFSLSNIGTLSSWRITRSLGSGAAYEGPTSVDKGASFSATVTLAEGYEIGTAGVTVTMGGTVLSGAHSISGNVITITIASVTGNVLIKVPTINTATGEEEEPEVPDTPVEPDEPVNLITLEGVQLYDNTRTNATTAALEADSSNTYFTYAYIPVTAGKKIRAPYSRSTWFYKSNKTKISKINLTTEATDYTTTVPTNAAYVVCTAKYAEISPQEFKIYYVD